MVRQTSLTGLRQNAKGFPWFRDGRGAHGDPPGTPDPAKSRKTVMASIRKRTLPSGKTVWQCDYRDQAGKRRSRQFRKKADADSFMVKARHEVSQGTHTPDSTTVTVDKAFALLIAALKAEGSAPSTISNYEVYYKNHVGPFLRARLLTRIGPADVQEYLDHLRADGRTPDTIRRAKNVLGALLDEAMRQRLVSSNPVRSLRARRRARRALIDEENAVSIPERDDVRRMIEAAGSAGKCWLIVRQKEAEGNWRTLELVEAPYPLAG
jgi:integrase